jgi:hypothetical protein
MCGHCHDGTPEGGKDLGQDGAKNSAKDRAKDGIDRRNLMALGVAAAATAAGVTRMLAPSPAVAAHSKPTSLSADDALSALKSGNARYVSQPQECVVGLAEARARVAAAQSPWATIISLRRQPRAAGASVRRSRPRRAVRCAQRRQLGRHGNHGHGRVRRGGARLAADRSDGTQPLRCGLGRL